MKTLPKATQLKKLIDTYFKTVKTETYETKRTRKTNDKKTGEQAKPVDVKSSKDNADPPTMTGLALFLGFDSLAQFEEYENKKRFGPHLKRARLLIIAAYEKKLHGTYTSGAIYALKSIGWYSDKIGDRQSDKLQTTTKVEMIESGPKLAENEKEVTM